MKITVTLPHHCLEHDNYKIWVEKARLSAGRGLRCPAWWRPLRRATPASRSPTRGTRDASQRLTLRPPSRRSASTGKYLVAVLNGAHRELRIHRRLQYLFSRCQYSGLRGPYLSDLLEVKLGLLLWISNFFFGIRFRNFTILIIGTVN